MAKAAELDKGLADGLKAAKSKRAYFAFVLKGSSDGALLVSKTKVPPGDIAAAKKECGGSAVLKGFCQYEDGKYIFETAKAAPATAAQAVKVIAKRDAGMAIHAEFRVGSDPELLAEEGDSSPASTPQGVKPAEAAQPSAAAQPQPILAELSKRLNGLTAEIKAALAGPNKARVQALFVAVNGQIKNQDAAAATKSLDELEQLVKQAPPPSGAELAKRLNGMTAQIKTALAGPNKAGVQSLFVAVNGQIKNQDFAAAAQGLDELEALVNTGGGNGATPTGAEPAKKESPALAAALQAWTAARTDAVGQLAKLVAAFKTSNHPQAAAGIALLDAVIKKQLTPRPATPQQVNELVRYVNTDDIFTDVETPNPFGFTVNVRQPLLAALAELKKHVA